MGHVYSYCIDNVRKVRGVILQVFENYYLTKQRIFVGKNICGDFPGGPVVKTQHSQRKGLGSISGQGTRSCMPQLRPGKAKEIH